MGPRKQSKDVLPTGECWYGSGTDIPIGSFFAAGHDKVAESAVILTGYGVLAGFLEIHGFGLNGKNARKELEQSRLRGGRPW